MKNIVTKLTAAIVIGGLVLLPSLYAWFNIKASWDPYGQTDEIPIGVVNEDEGATIQDESFNVGDMLVDNLKENKDMNWQFVDKKKAMDKVEYGDYFATIVIPKDFSEKLASIESGQPQKADLDYYVNEKINAIAPKITDKGASVIVEEISSNFTATVNGVIFDLFNKIGLELEEDQPDIEKFEEYIFLLEENLPDIHKTLKSTDNDVHEAKGIIKKAQDRIPEVKEMADDGESMLYLVQGHLNEASSLFNELTPKIESELKNAKNMLKEANKVIDQAAEDLPSQNDIDKRIQALIEDNTGSIDQLEVIESALANLKGQLDPDEDKETIEKIEETEKEIANLKASLEKVSDKADEINNLDFDTDQILKDIKSISKATTEKIEAFEAKFTNEIKPAISNAINDVQGKINSASDMIYEIQETLPQVEKLLNNTDGTLDDGAEILQEVLKEFPYVQDKVNSTAKRIRELQEDINLGDIIELLKNDANAEESFFKEPVVMHKNELFPIPNYGTGMTPFYTVLAVWVGALLLISILTTDLPNEIEPKTMYLGRWLTFLTLGLAQTLIVSVGDITLIGVKVAHPVWFVVFSLIISVVFMTIVYSLVSMLSDVGKAAAIVLLVLQIAGSGGTYPVVLLPEFFQAINPFLPFTYAVDLLREAVGGIVWQRARWDIIMLVIFWVIFVGFSVFAKGPVNKFMKKVMGDKDSRLFH